jgi:hypothetical protein
MLTYTVAATFSHATQAEAWLRWLREGHIAEVLAGGAVAAEIVQMEGSPHSYEVRYRFLSRDSFTVYERDHAPRLRAEGVKLFPPEQGITYRRTVGQILDTF